MSAYGRWAEYADDDPHEFEDWSPDEASRWARERMEADPDSWPEIVEEWTRRRALARRAGLADNVCLDETSAVSCYSVPVNPDYL